MRADACCYPKSGRFEPCRYGGFRDEHERAHELMEKLKIAHEYRDGPARKHDWHSGWVKEAAELLLGRKDKE